MWVGFMIVFVFKWYFVVIFEYVGVICIVVVCVIVVVVGLFLVIEF